MEYVFYFISCLFQLKYSMIFDSLTCSIAWTWIVTDIMLIMIVMIVIIKWNVQHHIKCLLIRCYSGMPWPSWSWLRGRSCDRTTTCPSSTLSAQVGSNLNQYIPFMLLLNSNCPCMLLLNSNIHFFMFTLNSPRNWGAQRCQEPDSGNRKDYCKQAS